MGSDIGGYIRLRISRVRHLRLRTTLGLYPFVYFQCPALAFYGSLTYNLTTGPGY